MRIDIWSDVICPFCYIGKRHLEQALADFVVNTPLDIHWHSFLLDPDMEAKPGVDIYAYLAQRKGQSLDWSRQAHAQVTRMAADAGLLYDFDKVVVASSLLAHQLIQMAEEHGCANEVEELLFQAYFTEGADIADASVLQNLGVAAGLPANEISSALSDGRYLHKVYEDHAVATEIGARGVPLFVFNRRHGLVGAQPSAVFRQALEKAISENI